MQTKDIDKYLHFKEVYYFLKAGLGLGYVVASKRCSNRKIFIRSALVNMCYDSGMVSLIYSFNWNINTLACFRATSIFHHILVFIINSNEINRNAAFLMFMLCLCVLMSMLCVYMYHLVHFVLLSVLPIVLHLPVFSYAMFYRQM